MTVLDPDPFKQFSRWYQQARKAGIDKPNAMTLATVDSRNRPDARVVLLSSHDERGFVFHTNYLSSKGRQLAHSPYAVLLFWWDPLDYQVRIEGRIEKTSAEESDLYFSHRPRGSQLGAWASQQSEELESRAQLQRRMREFEQKYQDGPVPRPPHWGGYRLIPEQFEFWIGRQDRLHDRFLYSPGLQQQWKMKRLSP